MTAQQGIEITWLGHAATKIRTPAGKSILIDPWIKSNPSTPDSAKNIDQLDLMLITHGHFDHLGDAIDIAKATNPDVITIFELAQYLGTKGVEKVTGINTGGSVDWQGITITMVDAVHSSGISEGDQILYGGTAAGFVLRFENGFTLYHAGDTDVFESMKLIAERYSPDVAMLPIGGHYTMDPQGAAHAARLLQVSAVIPLHYGTFPALSGTPDQLKQALSDTAGVKVVAPKAGETVNQTDLV